MSEVHAGTYLGPGANRDLDRLERQVGVPRLLEQRPEVVGNMKVHAELDHGGVRRVEKGRQTRAAQAVVVGQDVAAVLLDLDPPARLGVSTLREKKPRTLTRQERDLLERLPDHLANVLGDGSNVAQVHQVKIIAVEPLVLKVVDDELDIGRDPGGLDGAEVGADDLGAGELVRDCGC